MIWMCEKRFVSLDRRESDNDCYVVVAIDIGASRVDRPCNGKFNDAWNRGKFRIAILFECGSVVLVREFDKDDVLDCLR